MRVAVNTRLLIKNKLDGIGRFSLEILKRITKNNPNVEFHFIFDRPFDHDFIFEDNVIPHILQPQTRHPILWYIWLELQLPKLLKDIKPDVFFSPDGFTSRKNLCKSIIVIHDINFEHRPKDLKWAHSIFYRTYFKQYAQLATSIITVSNFSKKDIAERYNINRNKIHVAYNGVSENFHKISDENKLKIKQKYTAGKDFFVFIGTLHKRKNIKNLLLSFNKYCQKGGRFQLVIIGEKKWADVETINTYKKLDSKQNVIFLNRVSESDLPNILGSSKALCFVSFFEGFGIPIIEAMKCEVPIICSNTSALPEVANDAAILVNPNNTEDITKAMFMIENDEKLCEDLIYKGKQRVCDFNWDDSANKIWSIIKKV